MFLVSGIVDSIMMVSIFIWGCIEVVSIYTFQGN
jgi:hypothetical protein